MRHLKPKITQRSNNGGTISFCVDAGIINGKRHRRFFPTKTAAQQHAEHIQEARVKFGNSAFSLNDQQRVEALHAFEKLKGTDASLTEAVDFFLRHNKPKNGKKLVSEIAVEFVQTRIQASAKPRYIKALRSAFGMFNESFGKRHIHEIARSEIEAWLNSRELSPLTRRGYLRDLGMLFKFAYEEGFCAENIIKRIKKPTLVEKPTEIFSVPEAIIILSMAQKLDKSLIPYLTIGLFAGLRSSELETLDWNEINLDKKRIEVKAEKAKTSRRRFVEISDNLCAWLKPHEKMEGCITTPGWRERLQKVSKQAEFDKWPRNGLRHSFGSYHLARNEDASKTAMQMGHENTKMLYAHYYHLVDAEQAEQYWNIFPPKNGWLMEIHQPNNQQFSTKTLLNRLENEIKKTRAAEFQ